MFKVIAFDETGYWDVDTLADNKITHAFGVYLFLVNERTHICSLTPNSRTEFLENSFLGPDQTDHDLHHYNSGPSTDYHGFIDVTKRDPRFITSVSTRARTNWDQAREDWQSNPTYPDILSAAVHDAYQTEQRLKRLALNTPPLSNPSLPLFLHPAKAIFEALDPGPGAPFAQLRQADQALQATFKSLHWR